MGKEKNLLKRFLKGAASEKEAEKVETWLDNKTGKDNPWESLDNDKRAAFLKDLKKDIDRTLNSDKKGSGVHKNLFWGAIAAAVIVVVMIPIYALWLRPSPVVLPKLARQHLMHTAIAQIKEVQLPDGSKIWLNAKTKLRYSDSFGIKSRDVYLTGQAYFEIARDTKHPFVVHADSWKVTVLGTQFDIADYKEDNEAAVAVLSGKVAVHSIENSNKGKTWIIHPGEGLAYNKVKGLISTRKFSPAEQPAWVRKDVVFDHSKLTEVAKIIERSYGMQMQFSRPEIGQMEVSGNFGKIDNAKSLIEMICLTINAQYTINGNNVMITDMH